MNQNYNILSNDTTKMNTTNTTNITLVPKEVRSDKYNYTLNGIEHHIILNENLKINSEPYEDKILISNKFLLKYINDLLNENNIEYFITYKTLLGKYIFNGINLFEKDNHLCIFEHHYNKLIKLKDDILKDNFYFEEANINDSLNSKQIKIYGSFFDKLIVNCYIYILKVDENKKFNHNLLLNNEEEKIDFEFYDIYPLKEVEYEEFKLFIPNKITNILLKYDFKLNNLILSKNINEKTNTENEKSKLNYFSKKNKNDKKEKNKIIKEKDIFEEELNLENNTISFQNDFNSSIFNKLLNKIIK